MFTLSLSLLLDWTPRSRSIHHTEREFFFFFFGRGQGDVRGRWRIPDRTKGFHQIQSLITMVPLLRLFFVLLSFVLHPPSYTTGEEGEEKYARRWWSHATLFFFVFFLFDVANIEAHDSRIKNVKSEEDEVRKMRGVGWFSTRVRVNQHKSMPIGALHKNTSTRQERQ